MTAIEAVTVPEEQRFADCLCALFRLKLNDQFGGRLRLGLACQRCVEHDLSDDEAVECIFAYCKFRPFPGGVSDDEIISRLRAAENGCRRGAAYAEQADATPPVLLPQYLTVEELMATYPGLREPVIEGLLREGETMNVIATQKTGKSWLVTDLVIAVAMGRPWLGRFPTRQGSVLVLDNELHGETIADRIPKVARARGIDPATFRRHVCVENLRGRLVDLVRLRTYFRAIQPGLFKVVVLDAFYRFIPPDTDENDNGTMARLYNYIDSYALDLRCSFVLVHHTTKGSQSNKSVTDVGAGAGAQSRAADTHLILRAHEEPKAVVLDAAIRSWPPIEPVCLRRECYVWDLAPDLDPALLKSDRPSRRRKAKPEEEPGKLAEPPWDAARFVREFVRPEAKTRAAVIEDAIRAGLSERRAERLLLRAEDMGLTHRWKFDSNAPVKYATVSQPLMDVGTTSKPVKKRKRKK